MYFITSVRIVPEDKRPYYFAKPKQRIKHAIFCTIRHPQTNRKTRRSLSEWVDDFKFWWEDGWQKKFPIEHRTWGYYVDKDRAFQAADENWSDMHECYYKYVVVEKVPEGIWPEMQEQYFWQWDNATEKFLRCDGPPQELVDAYSKWGVVFNFTDI